MSPKKWQDYEDDYVLKNYVHLSDKKMAAYLGRSASSVTERRRKLGLSKNKKAATSEQVQRVLTKQAEIREQTPIEELDTAQKRRYYISELEKSQTWVQCQDMFDKDELSFYRHKHVEFMMNLDTVNEIEKNSIHLMISYLIRINRFQKQEKRYRQLAADGDDAAGAEAITLNREIKDIAELYLKQEDKLNASRAQRIKQEGEQRMTVIELLKELESREAREKLGREADAFKFIQDMEDSRLREQSFIRSNDGSGSA